MAWLASDVPRPGGEVQAAAGEAGGLVEAVLAMLGLEEKNVSETDTLESLGMDSMQVAEIRARLQRALGRPIPLEEARLAPRSPSPTLLTRMRCRPAAKQEHAPGFHST